MIDPEIRILGFEGHHYQLLVELLSPDVGGSNARAFALFVVDEEDTVLLARDGRMRPIRVDASLGDLAELGRRLDVSRIVVVQEGALEEMAERVSLRLSTTGDYLTQLLMLAQGVREMEAAGWIRLHPPTPGRRIPLPPPARSKERSTSPFRRAARPSSSVGSTTPRRRRSHFVGARAASTPSAVLDRSSIGAAH